MAVFEKKVQRRNQLDDTDVLTCTVESSQNIQGHTEYIIRVQRGPIPDKHWYVRKRFRDFANLHSVLSAASGLSMPLPPKRLIGNMDPVFVAERLVGLQNYLNFILYHPFLSTCLPLKHFLDPDNYSTFFQESALPAVSLALRGEADWELLQRLPDLGWRIRKHYFAVQRRPSTLEHNYFLSWTEYGPDMSVEIPHLQAALNAVFSLLGSITVPSELLRCNETGCLIIRRVGDEGSLRDMLCKSKIRASFLRKYCCPKQTSLFSSKELSLYSFHILQILATLHHKSVPYGQLHAGNVCIEKGRALLLDVEGGLLGLPSFLRPFILQHRRLDSLPRVDMYCFGHLLYEMAFGYPLRSSTLERDAVPRESSLWSPSLVDIFEKLLSSRALREALPTAQQLLQHEFFKCVCDEPPIRQNHKFPGLIRESMKSLATKIEERLRHDQKAVHHQRRLVRVQEMMSSEEEKKKRKERWKQKERERQQPPQPLNGKSPERSDSPASTSTATSAGTVTPPSGRNDGMSITPTPPPQPLQTLVPPPPPPLFSPGASAGSSERSALLNSICAFNKSSLRHTASPSVEKRVAR